jgi:hypothetical protein
MNEIPFCIQLLGLIASPSTEIWIGAKRPVRNVFNEKTSRKFEAKTGVSTRHYERHSFNYSIHRNTNKNLIYKCLENT